ncbi:MAG: DUF427 domain-containing protein [Gammaproteobacteria bacterium]
MWKYTGKFRPSFAESPKAGQESVWDYPRPPALKTDSRRVKVFYGKVLLAESHSCLRVLETAGAPTFYIPPEDVNSAYLKNIDQHSFCEWKGIATYCCLDEGSLTIKRLIPCGWQYTNPTNAFVPIKDHYSFYPARVDCFVNEEQVRPQAGDFYGGWITSEIVGPIKGGPGTEGW